MLMALCTKFNIEKGATGVQAIVMEGNYIGIYIFNLTNLTMNSFLLIP